MASQEASGPADTLWADVSPLLFTAKEMLAHGVKRLGEVEIGYITHVLLPVRGDDRRGGRD